jgi:transposase-like protein
VSSREEENAAAEREPKRKGACPFCWSYNIIFNEYYETWRCQKCERSFQTPSFGLGGAPPTRRSEPMGFLTAAFEICPYCNQRKLLYHKSDEVDWEYYKCHNNECNRVYGVAELGKIKESKT